MSVVPVYDMDGKQSGKLELDKKVFDGRVNEDLVHQVLVMYHANRRSGTAATKNRSEVRGGGRKPWRQKGTGRARAGSIRSPLWKGGGVTFGPRPRDYSYSVPKKLRVKALLSGLNAKVNENGLIVVKKIELDEPKTKKFKAVLDGLKVEGKCMILLTELKDNLIRAARNIPRLTLKKASDVNVYDLLDNDKVIITQDAVQLLVKRVKG